MIEYSILIIIKCVRRYGVHTRLNLLRYPHGGGPRTVPLEVGSKSLECYYSFPNLILNFVIKFRDIENCLSFPNSKYAHVEIRSSIWFKIHHKISYLLCNSILSFIRSDSLVESAIVFTISPIYYF